MKKTVIAGAVFLALTLSACTTQGDKVPASSLRFSYVTEGAGAIGLVRAFDDGERTALMFVTDPPAGLLILNEQGESLPYERIGQNAVLHGLHSPLRVQIGHATATVKSTAPISTELIQQPSSAGEGSTTPADVDPELLAARVALKLAEKQIAELRAELEKMKVAGGYQVGQDDKGMTKRIDQLERLVADAASVILRVEFGFGSADFKPAEAVAQALIPAAKAAESVTVRGFTDSTVIDEANTRMALARALATRRYLISQGVDATKIRARYISAGGFVADNSTPEGRAKNRRVDIELVNTQLAHLGNVTAQLIQK